MILDFTMQQFAVRGISHHLKGKTNYVVTIRLERIYVYHLVTTYFPTCCLLTISCLIVYIDPKRFEATITLSLTTMLVMQTLHQSIIDDFPKTAYMKNGQLLADL